MFNKKTVSASKKVSIEYAQFQLLRRISLGLYLVLAIILVGALWFLYRHMYRTIGQVEELSILSPVASIEILDMDGFDAVTALQEIKNHASLPILLRDPFNPIPIEPLSSVVSTTTSTTLP